MKEVIDLDDFLRKNRDGIVFDFRQYAEKTGGEIIAREPSNPTGDSVSLVEMVYGNWKVMLGSAASIMSDDDSSMHYICRSMIDVTNTASDTSEYCAYYGEWDPETSDTVIFCSENDLIVTLRTLREFHKLIDSGNLSRNDIECPFAGTGIKHKELVRRSILVPHYD